MGKVMQIDEHAPAAVKEALDKKELSINQGYQITKQVEDLPEEQRAAVTLYYYEDLPVAEIARVLGVAQGTVKSRLGRARQRLKEQLQEEEI